jgi:hypothetical protein
MKSSQIAANIEGRNPKLHIGATTPFLPLPPGAMGSKSMVGWIAFNLIRILESFPETSPSKLWWNYRACSFAVMNANQVPIAGSGWEEVEFDGYGGLETWKELLP